MANFPAAEMDRVGEAFVNAMLDDMGYTRTRTPAWVCQQCGETYFEEKEVDSIQELLQTLDAKTRALELTSV